MEGHKHLSSANTNNSSVPSERKLCLLSLLFYSRRVHFRQKAIFSVFSFPFHSWSFLNTSSLAKTPLLFQVQFLFCSELPTISHVL